MLEYIQAPLAIKERKVAQQKPDFARCPAFLPCQWLSTKITLSMKSYLHDIEKDELLQVAILTPRASDIATSLGMRVFMTDPVDFGALDVK